MMKKVLKIFGIVGAIFAVLVIAGIIIVPLVVDPNDYKDEITQYVHKATGQNIAIEGNIELSVFPWVGLKTGPVVLANPPGFGDAPLSRAEHADIRLKLMPLFRKQVMMKTLLFKGLDIHLIRNSDGKANWEAIGAKKEDTPEKSDEEGEDQGIKEILAGLDIEGVKLTSAKLRFDDQIQGTSFQIKDLNIRTGRLKLGTSCPLNVRFNFDSTQPALKAGVDLETEIHLLIDEHQADLKDTRVGLTLLEMKTPDTGMSATADVAAQILVNWGDSHLKMNGLSLKSNMKGTQIPGGETSLTLNGGLDLDWAKGLLSLSDLDAKLDDTVLQGAVTVDDFKDPKIKFDLSMGDIDINRYLPGTERKSDEKSSGKAGQASSKGSAIPHLNGNLHIASLKVRDMTFSDVRLNVREKKGRIRFSPMAGGKKAVHSPEMSPLGVDLQFRLDSAQPAIKTRVGLSTDLGLFLNEGQVALNNTRLVLDEFRSDLQNKETAIQGNADLAGNMRVDWTAGRVKASSLDLKSSAKGKPVPGGTADLALTGGADFDWKKGTLSLTDLTLAAYDARITGNADISQISANPVIKTDLNIAKFSLKKLMRKIGVSLPETRDPTALDTFSGTFGLTAGQDSVNIRKLRATLDRTTFQGTVDVSRFKPLNVRFDLAADEIKIDRYLRPPGSETEKTTGEATPGKPSNPLETLRETNINGTLRIAKLRTHKVEASDLRLTLSGKDGLIKVEPLSAMLYQGKLRTTLSADIRKADAETNVSINLNNMELGSFVQRALGKNLITGGLSNIAISLRSQGDTLLSHLKTLNGSGGLTATKAVLKGHSISSLIEGTGYPVGSLLSKFGVGRGTSRTDIDAVNAQFEIQNGNLLARDFSLKTPNDRVTLTGSANLAEQTLDCKVSVNLGEFATIPIMIKGPFQNPTITPDISGVITKSVINKIGDKLGDKIGDLPFVKPGKDAAESGKKILDTIRELPFIPGKTEDTDHGASEKKDVKKPLDIGIDLLKEGAGLFGIKKKEDSTQEPGD